jgi:primosomal protein N' (replication factor Y)
MQKRAGKHRAQLLLQAIHRKDLKNYLEQLTQHLNQLKNKQRVRWSIDVDPQEIF